MRKALLLLALGLATVHGADWPQFRGPERDNVWADAEVADVVPAGGWPILWRQPVQFGWSSPVVAEGRVFVSDTELTKPKVHERVLCFEETTGKPLWTFSYEEVYPEWVYVEAQNAGPSATPIVENGRVYCVGATGKVHCLNAATGEVIWKRFLTDDYKISEMQCRSSPLIEGEHLILLVGGKPDACFVALDKATGKEFWHASTDTVSNSSPIALTVGGVRQIVAWTGDSALALDPVSGAILWRLPMNTSNNDNIATPVTDGKRVLISGLMLELDAATPAATPLWPKNLVVTKRLLSNTCSPCLRGDYIYAARSKGEFVCLKSATGELVWETDQVTAVKSASSIHATPIGGDRYLLFNDQGELILATLTPAGYQETGRSQLLAPTSHFSGLRLWVAPAYANGRVIARNDKEVVCVSVK